VPKLNEWREAAALAGLAEFAAVPRPGVGMLEFPKPFHGRVLKGFPVEISSSQIRARIRANLPIDQLVPPPVNEAIRNNQLYL
jgi:nicotinic acid mononucleotide adenylyltransferase